MTRFPNLVLTVLLITSAIVVGFTSSTAAEMHYLAKQYSRCSACHYSETGGSLLTPYGRFLSREELSMTGRTGTENGKEHQSLYGFIGKWTERSGFDLGVTMRPSRLEFDVADRSFHRNLWMRADLQAAWQRGKWTAYAEVGRSGEDPPRRVSHEHWLAYRKDSGLGIKVGRFMPAFGLRVVDHTAYNRREVGFDNDGEIYGVEFSQAGEKSLVQVSLGPGGAESIIADDPEHSFTATGRLQIDLTAQHVLALSGLFRNASDVARTEAISSIAWGFAPTRHIALWTELDERVSAGWKGTPQYVVFHEASFEVTRGLWLKFSPQLITELANVSGGRSRVGLGLQFLPRTHWNFNLNWIRERDRVGGTVFRTLLLQGHIYL